MEKNVTSVALREKLCTVRISKESYIQNIFIFVVAIYTRHLFKERRRTIGRNFRCAANKGKHYSSPSVFELCVSDGSSVVLLWGQVQRRLYQVAVYVELMGPNLILLYVTLALAALASTSAGTPLVTAHVPLGPPGPVFVVGYVLSNQSIFA